MCDAVLSVKFFADGIDYFSFTIFEDVAGVSCITFLIVFGWFVFGILILGIASTQLIFWDEFLDVFENFENLG